MSKVHVLSEQDISKTLNLNIAIKGVESAYIQKSSKEACLFPMIFHEFDPGKSDMDIKSGHLPQSSIYGLKLVSWYGANAEKNLPQLFGTTLLFDDTTGEPIALLNAGGITGMRTGAAGAIGAKYLANPNASTLLMVGTGEQSPYQVAATLISVPTITNVLLYNPNNIAKSATKLPSIKQEVELLLNEVGFNRDYSITAVEDIENAVAKSEIIITATPSHKPLINYEWIKPGTHISCIGADMGGKQELDGKILANARVFTDDIEQSVNVGECELPINQGIITKKDIIGEIGLVISGELKGRTSEKDITVFDSTGIALQDLIVSKETVDMAKQQGIGTIVEL